MEVPASYKNAAICNLVGGGVTAVFSLLGLLGSFCMLFWFIFAVPAGMYQAWVGWQMFNGEPSPAGKNAAIAGMIGGFLGMNPLSFCASAAAFYLVGQDEVKGWLEQNGAA